ncbi:MAG: hypothetical protein K6U80_20050 [Firmicutes bacterium]|nr:hypothetical protein [Bacillota bacterium]
MNATFPMFDQKSKKELNQNIAGDIIRCCQKVNRPVIVLIDGKSAAGKSTMAEALKILLEKQNQPACVIEADWFLKERDFRIAELRRIITTRKVYINSHVEFWDWDELKRQLQIIYDLALTGGQLTLRNLYIRGQSETIKGLIIPKNSVILVPGCYIMSQDINDDLSIMIYVNREEGRRRKIDREYQKAKEGFFPEIEAMGTAILCWELLEEPTFLYHMITYGNKAQIIVDNSGPGKINVIKYNMRLIKSMAQIGRYDPEITRFIYDLSELGKEIIEIIQSRKAGEIRVQGEGSEVIVAFN